MSNELITPAALIIGGVVIAIVLMSLTGLVAWLAAKTNGSISEQNLRLILENATRIAAEATLNAAYKTATPHDERIVTDLLDDSYTITQDNAGRYVLTPKVTEAPDTPPQEPVG